MIGKIRRKLVIVIMISVAIVMGVIFVAMNAMNYFHMTKSADEMIALIAENNGIIPEYPQMELPMERIPEQLNRESAYQTRFFIVQYDKREEIIDINLSHIAAVSYEDAGRYARTVLDSDSKIGYMDIYRYKVQPTDFGKIVIFLDCSISMQSTTSMIITSCCIALISLCAIFLVICIFSSRFIRPMIESMEKQKRFVTDAGHELKTPLAIINANVEVMELTEGSNEWLESIKNQVKRMDQLVKSMLQLARMEEGTLNAPESIFDISNAFNEITESFKVVAQQKGKSLKINSQYNVKMSGDEASIRNLISILMDNAIKYCNDEGRIEARLSLEGKNIKIRVKNSSDIDSGENLQRLFDRFYRPDDSRARTSGGFGIGLSMAKNIVDAHHGRITAQRDGGFVCFQVTLKAATQSQINKAAKISNVKEPEKRDKK
ncbi:MAG: HAMP domain-containing sensor histidine kinase [bacterium]|nr:HAMP domain-containing sensor histidine kinase [bacterium]